MFGLFGQPANAGSTYLKTGGEYMRRTYAASILVAVGATIMWMGTSAYAADGFAGHTPITSAKTVKSIKTVKSVKSVKSVKAAHHSAGPSKCDGDHDADDHGCPGAVNANKCDGDRDSDDAGCPTSPKSCWTDRDRDDRSGRPTDHDGDESARCHARPHAIGADSDHAKRAHAALGDGDGDADDVTKAAHRCSTDHDSDDRTGRPSDHDHDVCGKG